MSQTYLGRGKGLCLLVGVGLPSAGAELGSGQPHENLSDKQGSGPPEPAGPMVVIKVCKKSVKWTIDNLNFLIHFWQFSHIHFTSNDFTIQYYDCILNIIQNTFILFSRSKQ